jgi:hypothetical protein
MVGRITTLVAIAIALVGPTWEAEASVINGGFEFPDVGPTGIQTFFPGPVPSGFGWTVNSGNVEVTGELYPPLPGPAFEGTQYLDLNGTSVGSIAQFFNTVPGVGYQLSFAYASNYAHHDAANPALASVFVTDVGSLTQLVTPFVISHGTSSSSDLDWVVHQLAFTAVGSSTGLGFNSESGQTPLCGILLDAIVVVPEPSTASLVGLGLLLLAVRQRRSPSNMALAFPNRQPRPTSRAV